MKMKLQCTDFLQYYWFGTKNRNKLLLLFCVHILHWSLCKQIPMYMYRNLLNSVWTKYWDVLFFHKCSFLKRVRLSLWFSYINLISHFICVHFTLKFFHLFVSSAQFLDTLWTLRTDRIHTYSIVFGCLLGTNKICYIYEIICIRNSFSWFFFWFSVVLLVSLFCFRKTGINKSSMI